jgi:hypothetical protein
MLWKIDKVNDLATTILVESYLFIYLFIYLLVMMV